MFRYFFRVPIVVATATFAAVNPMWIPVDYYIPIPVVDASPATAVETQRAVNDVLRMHSAKTFLHRIGFNHQISIDSQTFLRVTRRRSGISFLTTSFDVNEVVSASLPRVIAYNRAVDVLNREFPEF